MSELEGENKVKDKNISFDSGKIESKDKSKLFTKIEGEEARKAAAERARKSAHDKEVREKAEEIENSEKLERKLKKAEQESKTGNYTKNKKRIKIVVIVAIILVILCICGYFAIKLLKQYSENQRLENDRKAESYSLNIYTKAKEKQVNESLGVARDFFEQEIDKASEEQKVYLYIYYATFVAEKTNDSIRAKEFLEKAMSLARNDTEIDAVKAAYSSISLILNDYSFDIYEDGAQ